MRNPEAESGGCSNRASKAYVEISLLFLWRKMTATSERALLAHFVARNAPRITPAALRKEEKQQKSAKKERCGRAVAIDDPIAVLVKGRAEELDRMSFMYY